MAFSTDRNDAVPRSSSEQTLSTRANIIWNSAGNFIYLFCQWLLTYLVVRILGYESAGVFSLAMTLATSFYCIALYTMRNYQVSDVNDDHSARTYLWSRLFTCACSLIACFAFTLANGYDAYTFACVMAYMFFKVSEALSDVFQGMMQRRMRMDYIGISFVAKSVIELAVFFGALLLTENLLLAIALLAASSFAIVLTYDRSKGLKNTPLGSSSWQLVRDLLATCLPIAVFGFLFTAAGQIPRYFIQMALGTEALGYYASIAMPVVIVQVAASFIFSPLITPMAMHLSNGERNEFIALIKKTLVAIAAIALVSFAGFALLGDWALHLLFGDSILPYTYLLMPLVLCTVLTALAWFLTAVATVLRKLKSLLVWSGVMLAFITCSSYPFIQAFGMNGASFALAIGLAILCIGCTESIASTFRSSRDEARQTQQAASLVESANDSIRVSVIVAAYNAERYLPQCLDSALNQAKPAHEIIVVNDGSTDATQSILEDYAKCNPGIIKVLNQRNSGAAAARNAALAVATGDYFAYLDSDDTIDPDYLLRFSSALGKGSPDVICGGYRRINKEGTVIAEVKPVPGSEWGPYIVSAGCSKLYRTEFIRQNAIAFPSKQVGEDLLFVFQTLATAQSIGVIDYCGYNYLDNENSASNSFALTFDEQAIVGLLQGLLERMRAQDACDDPLHRHFIVRTAVWYVTFLKCPVPDSGIALLRRWLDENLAGWRKSPLASPFRPRGDAPVNRIAVWLFSKHPRLFGLAFKLVIQRKQPE